MFSPEEQQIEICLLKSNLEDIENDLIVQRSALPALDAENEQKYRETMTALRVARSLNMEMERLKQESVRLTAKRMQLKRQCDDITKALERARGNRSELGNLLKQEEQAIELEIRKYEDALREIASRFRSNPAFYNEDKINNEMETIKDIINQLEIEERNRQVVVKELKQQLESLEPLVPDGLLKIIGKAELDAKVKSLRTQSEELHGKRDYILRGCNMIQFH